MNRTKQLQQIKNRLSQIVEQHEKLKNSYFWSPSGNASGRRYNEKKNNDFFECDFLNISAENNYRESCNHVYYKGHFYVDGKKTTVTKIKNIISALDFIC
jgi:hypothetical protein